MKASYLGLIALSASIAFAQTVKDWDAEYKKVSAYDSEWVGRLKNNDGTWKRPKPEIVAVLKNLRPQIEAAAKELGVDQRAIAGSILSENSLNVGISDGAIDLLMKMGLSKTGKIGSHQFTVGLGQLNASVARESENYVARLEHRKALTDNELGEALQDPARSVRLVAQVLKQTQDIYKSYGYDISKDPAVLSTLYNLGQPEKRAKEAKAANRAPRENYFGLFVDKNISVIEKSVGKPQTAAIVAAVAPTTIQAAAPSSQSTAASAKTATIGSSKNAVKTASKNQTANLPAETKNNSKNKTLVEDKSESTAAAASKIKLTKRVVLSKSLSLSQGPPTCAHEQYGNNIDQKYEKYKNFGPAGVAEAGQAWTLLAPTIDCEANEWSLIRLEDGTTGWAKSEDIKNVTKEEYRPSSTCSSKENSKCRADIESAATKQLVKNSDSETKVSALTYLNPIVREGSKPNFKNKDVNCGNKSEMNAPKAFNRARNSLIAYDASTEKNKSKSFSNIQTQIAKIKKGLGNLSDPGNPYATFNNYQALNEISTCINDQLAKSRACNIDVAYAEKALAAIKIPKSPSLADIHKMQNGMNGLANASAQSAGKGRNSISWDIATPWAATAGEIASVSKKSAVDALNKCNEILKKNSVNTYFLEERRDSILQIGDDAWSTDDLAKFSAANLVKACAADAELFWGAKIESEDKNTAALCGARYGEVVNLNYVSSLKKEIARKYYSLNQIENTIRLDFEKVMPFSSFTATSSNNVPSRIFENGSYCPNRTAEWIEGLLEAHPCVSHIYVPDAWLVARLNALGAKVIYRPFEKDDVFAMDYSEVKCK